MRNARKGPYQKMRTTQTLLSSAGTFTQSDLGILSSKTYTTVFIDSVSGQRRP